MKPTNLDSRFRLTAGAWRPKGSDRLELWLPRDWPNGDAELRWRRTAGSGAVRQGSQRGLEGIASAEEIIVWIPAAEALLLSARLPTRSEAKIAQALPYALEEQVVEPPERLHFAFTREADGALAVAVASRERMDRWLSALAAAGLEPTRLAPVTLSLPLAERSWALAFFPGEIALRSGLYSGLGGPMEPRPPAWLHAALAEARSESRAPERILLFDAPQDLDIAAWSEALGLPLEAARHGDAAVPAAQLNLLQQRYAPRGRMSALWTAYAPAAALLAAWLVATLVFDGIEWARLAVGCARERAGDARAAHQEFSGHARRARSGGADAPRPRHPERGGRSCLAGRHARPARASRPHNRARVARQGAEPRVRRARTHDPPRGVAGGRRIFRPQAARAIARGRIAARRR